MQRNWDRLSVAVSVLLIGGLVMAGWAMIETSETNPPQVKKLKKPAAPVAANIAVPPAAIRLPPPPRRSVAKTGPILFKAIPKPPPPKPFLIKPLRAQPRPVARARTAPVAEKTRPVVLKPLRPAPVKPRQARAALRQKSGAMVRPKTVPVPTPQNNKTGRALLRMVEHGKGPTIRIAWPEARASRDRLYRLLSACYGMRAAIMSDRQVLYRDAGLRGESWKIDTDRFSGFLRAPEGEPIAKESVKFTRIAARHGVTSWQPVRVFPRDVDAVLLGGLNQILGSGYGSARSITAAYRLDQGRLTLSDIRADGQSAAGIIAIPPPRGLCA